MESFVGITAFVHSAEQRSYIGAARVIGVSPSAVGKAIARLEERLGVRLFNRTTRSISLTDEGEVLYERYRRILDEMRDAEATIVRSCEQPRGRLRISMPHIVAHHLVVPLLPDFSRRFPEIELDIDLDDRVVDLVAEGLDIVVRSGELSDARFIARPIGDQHFVVCGSPQYLEQRGAPENPDDLSRHACIRFKYPSSGMIAPWSFQAPFAQLPLRRDITFNNTDAGLRAAIDGMGLAHLPVYVARPSVEGGALVPVLTPFMAPLGSLSLVWPTNRQLSPKVRSFVDFLVPQLARRVDAFRPAHAWPGMDMVAKGAVTFQRPFP